MNSKKFGDSDVSGGGHCHVVHVYVTVTRREEAVRLINVLTKLNISVRSDRIDQRYVNMYGNLRLGDIKRFERMCRENGWVVSYFNNSKACLEKVLELQKENEIILEHITISTRRARKSCSMSLRAIRGKSKRLRRT